MWALLTRLAEAQEAGTHQAAEAPAVCTTARDSRFTEFDPRCRKKKPAREGMQGIRPRYIQATIRNRW